MRQWMNPIYQGQERQESKNQLPKRLLQYFCFQYFSPPSYFHSFSYSQYLMIKFVLNFSQLSIRPEILLNKISWHLKTA